MAVEQVHEAVQMKSALEEAFRADQDRKAEKARDDHKKTDSKSK
jgi:hypothetical protein